MYFGLERWPSQLEQLATQQSGYTKQAAAEQQDAAGLGGGRRRGCGAAAEDGEGLRRNRSYGALRSERRTAVHIPVNGIASGADCVRQVQPVAASVQGYAAEAAGLGADVEAAIRVAGASREVDSLIEEAGAAKFAGSDRHFSGREGVTGEQPRAKGDAIDRRVAAQGELVADGKAEVDCPTKDGTVDGTVVVEVILGYGRNYSQAQGEQ